ncbi:MAG: hypothetical protein KDI92_11075 [Xanthomonadales bacterium]|nr:hypothetical protein [Xanthomonadales bacterium]
MNQTKITLSAMLCLLGSGAISAPSNTEIQTSYQPFAAGGPDAYGYTWADSNEVGGPVFSWIDITIDGTQITGLSDDNSVPMIDMGMNFQYYWAMYSQIKIGSNGWMSFNNVGNIAHCFPQVPTQGGAGDNFLAPYMSDLNFTGTGNPAEAYYYYDSIDNKFIVSFINVPWWSVNSPGFIGSNTFQVILDGNDNSITYQYADMDQANFNNTANCGFDLEIGFENSTGNIGLEILNETVPADNYAIKISYPDVVLLDIEDPTPAWNQNNENKAAFRLVGEDINLVTNVKNEGNVDTTTDVDVNMTVFDSNNASVYTDMDTIASLMAQQDVDVNYASVFNNTAGNYRLRVETSSSSDINPSNNILETELVLQDISNSPDQLSYVTDTISTGQASWNGGTGGVGAFFMPPYDGWQIDSVEMFIVNNGGAGFSYTVAIYDNEGGNGLPGTLLAAVDVPEGSYTIDNWVLTQLPTPIVAPSNGFYVAWETVNNAGVAMGTVNTPPISRQSYELLAGQWSTYRNNNTLEFMIRVNMIDLIFKNGFE